MWTSSPRAGRRAARLPKQHKETCHKSWPAYDELLAGMGKRGSPHSSTTSALVCLICGKEPQSPRARQTGDLQLPGFHFHQQQIPRRQEVPGQKEDQAGPDEGEAQDDHKGNTSAYESTHPCNREVVGQCCQRVLQLLRGADQHTGTCDVSG